MHMVFFLVCRKSKPGIGLGKDTEGGYHCEDEVNTVQHAVNARAWLAYPHTKMGSTWPRLIEWVSEWRGYEEGGRGGGSAGSSGWWVFAARASASQLCLFPPLAPYLTQAGIFPRDQSITLFIVVSSYTELRRTTGPWQSVTTKKHLTTYSPRYRSSSSDKNRLANRKSFVCIWILSLLDYGDDIFRDRLRSVLYFFGTELGLVL